MSLIMKAPDVAMLSTDPIEIDVDAISFNGSSSNIQYTNNFYRDTDMRYTDDGSTIGNAYTLSFWFKPTITANQSERIIDVRSGAVDQVYSLYLRADGASKAYLNIQYSDTNSQFMFGRTPLNDSTIVDGAWNHCLYSAKQLGGTGKFEHNFAINDTVLTTTDNDSGDITATPIATTNTSIGKLEGSAGGHFEGCLSEIWMKDDYYDLSVESNRRKFISSNDKPVELPASPLVYLNGSASNWTNDGSTDLGTQSLNTITNCSNSPSD